MLVKHVIFKAVKKIHILFVIFYVDFFVSQKNHIISSPEDVIFLRFFQNHMKKSNSHVIFRKCR